MPGINKTKNRLSSSWIRKKQIIREDNRLGEFSWVYTYDAGGNIVSKIRCPYTEGEITNLDATAAAGGNAVIGIIVGYCLSGNRWGV